MGSTEAALGLVGKKVGETRMPWKRLLTSLRMNEQRSDRVHGMTFTDPKASTVALVRDYLRVARQGTVNDICWAIQRHPDGERGVRGICERLVREGELTVTYSLTRGPAATPRATYHTNEQSVWAGSDTGWREADFWSNTWNDD